ncbi:MAG: hypothetical protein F6K62_14535 [Sphaerospermopsis sp. SIO1G2]|nr:hypothetical protein [Sphaerospermopsis sp. SIO1G2]
MSQDIETALDSLDASNPEHWTTAGLPRMDVLRELLGKDDLTRDQIEKVRPGFNQEAAVKEEPEPEPAEELDEESELLNKLKEAEIKEEQLRTALDEAQKAFTEAQSVTNALRNAVSKNVRSQSLAEINKRMVAQSQARKLEKYEARKAILSKVDVSQLEVRSPLDLKLAQKRKGDRRDPRRAMG